MWLWHNSPWAPLTSPPQLCASSPHFHSATPMRSFDREKRSRYITRTSPKRTLNEKRFSDKRGSLSPPIFLVCSCPVGRTGDLLCPTNRDCPLHWHSYATFTFYIQHITHINQISSESSIYAEFCAHVKSAEKVKLHQPGKTSILCRSKSEIKSRLWVFAQLSPNYQHRDWHMPSFSVQVVKHRVSTPRLQLCPWPHFKLFL